MIENSLEIWRTQNKNIFPMVTPQTLAGQIWGDCEWGLIRPDFPLGPLCRSFTLKDLSNLMGFKRGVKYHFFSSYREMIDNMEFQTARSLSTLVRAGALVVSYHQDHPGAEPHRIYQLKGAEGVAILRDIQENFRTILTGH